MHHDSIEAVMKRLTPYLEDFDAIPRHAHAAYRSYHPKHLIEHSPRTTANCTYDHMVAEAERRFVQRRNIAPLVIRGLKVWLFGDHTAIRWKKMDEDGSTRNYPTQQAKDYDHQKQMPGFPPRPTRITVGYLLDAAGTDIVRVQVARPFGKNIAWCAAIVPGTRKWEEVTKQAGIGVL